VATASYEARKFGVHSAMPTKQAYKLCPDGIYVRPRFDQYKAVSKQIMDIFLSYTEIVEPLSLDEAYLDITHLVSRDRSAQSVALDIQRDIFDATRLTSSSGVSYNKYLAKIASGMNKPAGTTVIMYRTSFFDWI
jgi:DNA polymerase-4